MNRSLRRFVLPTLLAGIALAVRLSGDTPTPVPTQAASPTAVAPAAAGTPAPSPKVTPLQLPKVLEGVITQEEFEAYIKFQQELRENPEIKALSDQIRAKRMEMFDLQKKAQAAAQVALEARPDIKAIADKIKARNTRPQTAPPPTAAPGLPTAVPQAPTAAPVSPTPVAK